MHRHPILQLLFVASVAVVGCGDLKSATPDGGVDNGALGPGDKGALPSGYCCTADAECRDRHCVAVGSGGRMCLDACNEQSRCARRDVTFKCSGSPGASGFCQPPDVSFTCLPQAQYARGTRQTGECCTASRDGHAGEECEGNKCVAFDIGEEANPFVCSQWCEGGRDCPSGTVCSESHDCVPANHPYMCR